MRENVDLGGRRGATRAGGPRRRGAAVGDVLCLGFDIARSTSLTWDEPSFIAAGYAYLTEQQFAFNASHPPLMQDLAALSLVAHRPAISTDVHYSAWSSRRNPVVAFAHALLGDNHLDILRLALHARLPVLLLGALLVLGVYVVGRRFFGVGPALLGAVLAAFSPLLLGHGALATEDMGCAALAFFSIWALERAQARRARWRWTLAGVVTGLAFVAKYTALVLGPVEVVLVLMAWRLERPPLRVALSRAVCFAAPALVVIELVYGSLRGVAMWLGGLGQIYSDIVPNQAFYFLGHVTVQPLWYYEVAAWGLKEPVFHVAAALAGLALASWASRKRPELLWIVVPPLAFIGASFFDHENLGVRRILPALPFLYVLSAAVGAKVGSKGTLALALVGGLLGATAVARVHPDELGSFSELVGSSRGAAVLDDSNIDWGQDLPALARWQAAHPSDAPLQLVYFGTAEPAWYGVHAQRLAPAALRGALHGDVAVSVQDLIWLRKLRQAGADVPDPLEAWAPVARLGTSIRVYRFP